MFLSSLEKQGLLTSKDRILVYSIWGAVQVVFLVSFGINDHWDAYRYISTAQDIVTGHWDRRWNTGFYSAYIFVHVLLRLAGLPAKCMYVIQLLLSAVALDYFMRTLSLWVRSRMPLLISGILYAICVNIQQWVSILFTDPVFFDVQTIAIYYLLTERDGRMVRSWIFMILLPLIRPTGVLFSVIAFVYWLVVSPRWRRSVTAGIWLLFLGVWVYLALTRDQGFFFPNHNLEANVICGYPSGLLGDLRVQYREGMSVIDFLWANPKMTGRLFVERLFKSFSMSRSFYSSLHNWVVEGDAMLYYLLAVIGFVGLLKTDTRAGLILAVGVGVFCVPCVVFCVDSMGRFSLPVFCFVLLFAGVGVSNIYRWITGKGQNFPDENF